MPEPDIELDKLHEDNPRTDYGSDEELLLLGESIAKELHYPILVRPHATLAGYFLIVDGHRRCRAARRVGMKKIRAILVKEGLTEEEILLIQHRIDLHKKKMTEPERLKLIRRIADAHPHLNGKKLAELLEIHEATLSRYMGLSRLIPEAMVAFSEGKLGLKAAAEISTLKPEDQPALLQVRLGGGTVAELAEAKKKRNGESDTVKTDKLPIASGAGKVVIIANKAEEPFNLAGARVFLVDALAKVDAAIKDHWTTRTAARAWADSKDKPPKPPRKARKEASAN